MNPELSNALELAQRIASLSGPVLIVDEEDGMFALQVARVIHEQSSRAKFPFVEAEGDLRRAVELARGGTVFLRLTRPVPPALIEDLRRLVLGDVTHLHWPRLVAVATFDLRQ